MNPDDRTIRIIARYLPVILLVLAIFLSGCTETDRLADEAKASFESGRYAEAASLYDQAIRLSETNSRLYFLKGKTLLELVRHKDAIERLPLQSD